ncbi:uncharacterized protein LOC124645004 isoform X3 [Helicoverpa zea]|uniref:uncharacterized protein LOC124645004 isoform X3 n=1 Tax=Helicoverpa zea TaxID=7113 RepID=UPI001F56BBD6|nr:uncharacterized protein LOC124645004 isoform X3 [Helicoverpa zea]
MQIIYEKPICPCEKVTPKPLKAYPVPQPWVTFNGDEDQSIYEISAKMAALEVEGAQRAKKAKKEESVDDEASSAESDASIECEVEDSNDDDFTESDSETAEACASLVAIPAGEVASEEI